MKEQLRLDYFLNKCEFVTGDKFTNDEGLLVEVVPNTESRLGDGLCTVDRANEIDSDDEYSFVVSLAPRKNEGVQPCGDNVPVVVDFDNSDSNKFHRKAGDVTLRWAILNIEYPDIKSWAYDIDELIKMQIERDAQAVKHVEAEVITDPVEIYNVMAGNVDPLPDKAVWRPIGDLNTKQCTFNKPTYTQAMKDAGELPAVGMGYQTSVGVFTVLCHAMVRDSNMVVSQGDNVVELFNIHQVTPIQTPKQNQLSDLFLWLNKQGMVHNPDDIKKMQDAGWFAEVVEPLATGGTIQKSQTYKVNEG